MYGFKNDAIRFLSYFLLLQFFVGFFLDPFSPRFADTIEEDFF